MFVRSAMNTLTVNRLILCSLIMCLKGLKPFGHSRILLLELSRERKVLGVQAGMKYLKFESIGAQVSLAPKEMALYKFYLNHPEGVAYSNICDHRDELFTLYQEHYQQVHSDDAD
jgi:hypothetical protein